ncbi:CapA family protein [Candidatus Avoscillospira sp. LCP25S3_F1]|uniref:CapA family protein n=1 Tax=Candidatus Avoscillospira sp. LCP25S3_F1 TaxID=3438825 RepID=UPI003F904275
MADFDYNPSDYERNEQRLEARRLKRIEAKRRRIIRQRIILGLAALVILLIIVLVARGCGGDKTPPADNDTQQQTQQQDTNDTPALPTSSTATLSAVGDIMIYDAQLADAKEADGTYNFLPALAPVSSLLTAADVTVANFEANFAGEPAGYPYFRAPESLATTLAGLGVDILQTANTYSIQNGMAGLQSTVQVIRENGMSSLGTYLSSEDKTENQVVVKEVNGIRMAFIGFTKGVNNLTVPEGSEYSVDLLYTDYATTYNTVNTAGITAAVEAAKAKDPDVIVAMVHWGSEYETEISATQKQITNTLAQNGVDVIIGSHPHIVGKMEMQTVTVDGKEKQVFVAYSLGNFMGAMNRDSTDVNESVVLNLEFTKTNDSTTISKAEYVPIYFFDNGESAINRYEIRGIYDVLNGNPTEEVKTAMEAALEHLATNTESTYAAPNTAAAPTTTDDGGTTDSEVPAE